MAAGQFDKQLARAGSDELGFLVESFNQMTRNLAQARDIAQRSQELLESQRAYLETVLARLSSGVMTIDYAGRLNTSVAAASQILGVDLQVLIGADSQRIIAEHPVLQDLIDAIGPRMAQGGDWRQETSIPAALGGASRCRGSALPDAVGLRGGHVIVFDDITHLVRAERDAPGRGRPGAWPMRSRTR